MRRAARRLVDGIIVLGLACALLAVGIWIGRDMGRIDALAAEPPAPVVTAGKVQAWNLVHPTCKCAQGMGHRAGRGQPRAARSARSGGARE